MTSKYDRPPTGGSFLLSEFEGSKATVALDRMSPQELREWLEETRPGRATRRHIERRIRRMENRAGR